MPCTCWPHNNFIATSTSFGLCVLARHLANGNIQLECAGCSRHCDNKLARNNKNDSSVALTTLLEKTQWKDFQPPLELLAASRGKIYGVDGSVNDSGCAALDGQRWSCVMCWRTNEHSNSVCAASFMNDPGLSWNRIEANENRDFYLSYAGR